VIRNIEQQRCGDTQLPETLLGRHPEDFPHVVLPSTADLDIYVAMMADEERIRGLTSSTSVANRLNPQIGKRCCRSSPRSERPRIVRNQKHENEGDNG
jgi:hypothetical protein